MTALPLTTRQDIRWAARLQLCVALFSIVLVGATWPLWWPEGDYPGIPWLHSLISAPLSFDRGLAIGIVLTASGIALLSTLKWVHAANWERQRGSCCVDRWNRFLILLWLACLTGSVLLDQQRFQVWAWEFFWLTIFVNLASPQVARSCCRTLVIGIYFYSAISKIDVGFLETQGPWLWQGLQRAIGLENKSWGTTPTRGMWAFPLGELLVAALLSVRKTWHWGMVASWVMHGTLLLTLGPLGWNQKPGVLLWNVFFLITVPLTFREPNCEAFEEVSRPPRSSHTSRRDRLCWVAAVGLSLWPAFEVTGLCDHWPAWAVYSSRPEIVTIEVPDEQVALLPETLQLHVGPTQPLSNIRPISIDHWSFEQRHCPIYPNSRYRLAIARTLEERHGVQLHVIEQSSPARWTGQRQKQEIAPLAENLDQRFWFNTQARRPPPATATTLGDRMIAHAAQWAVGGYAIAILLAARQRQGQRPSRGVAIFWTLGLVGLMVHMVCAFHYLHHWIHAAALKHTALRTYDVTGWSWAGGLYINYAFLLFWIWDAVRIWRESLGLSPVSSLSWQRFVRGVFLFMMFNATVVFGPWHWTVAGVVFGLAWFYLAKTSSVHLVVGSESTTHLPPAGDRLE